MSKVLQIDESERPQDKLLAAAAFTGIAVGVVLTPIELIKCRVQVHANAVSVPSGVGGASLVNDRTPLLVIRNIINTDGPFGLFRGM